MVSETTASGGFISFCLHLLDGPGIANIASAVAWLDTPHRPSAASEARFAGFVGDIARHYPDPADDDPDGDDPANVWSEPLGDGRGHSGVLTLAPKTSRFEQALMLHIAHAAARAGLHVLDPQNALLFRADRQVVDGVGRVSPLAAEPPPPGAPPPPAPIRLDAFESHRFATERFCQRFASRGFVVCHDPKGRYGKAMRFAGELIQAVSIAVGSRDDTIYLRPTFDFRVPRVRAAWHPLLAAEIAPYLDWQRQVFGVTLPDFSLNANELLVQPGATGLTLDVRAGVRAQVDFIYAVNEAQRRVTTEFDTFVYVSTSAEFQGWIDRFDEWFERAALPALDTVADASSLARLVFTNPRLALLFQRNHLPLEEELNMLVLAKSEIPDRYEDWVALLRNHSSRQLNSPPLTAMNSAYVERLVAFLA